MIIDSLEDLAKLRLENPDRKIVMLSGAFDLFHQGHLDFVESAKARGDILVVCITSDGSLGIGKGMGRPIIQQQARANIVDAIRYVDYTFVNSPVRSDNFENWPGYHLRPDLIISGDRRWYHSDPRVKELGINTLLVDRGNTSTTDIIERIRSAKG